MKGIIFKFTILCFLVMSLSYLGYFFYGLSIYYRLFIIFLLIYYHLTIRLIVSYIFNLYYFDFHDKWFQPLSFEKKLYQVLKVNDWEGYMLTWNIESFSFRNHSLEEIIENMCGNEVIHEVNIILSFVPLLYSFISKEFWVLFVISLIGTIIDLSFVIMQRYNRPRIIKLLN